MSWTTALSELRGDLSDGPTDKLRYRKRCVGEVNGTNTLFKTFEFRRATNFTSPPAGQGVFVSGIAAASSTDFPDIGSFELSVAPVEGQIVEATYHVQWFLDTELDRFLEKSSQWLGLGGDVTIVTEGLRPAATKYAVHLAYQKLALRWAEHITETFRLEDSQDDKRMSIVSEYRSFSSEALKEATEIRDTFYTRQGQNLSPLWGIIKGKVVDPSGQS